MNITPVLGVFKYKISMGLISLALCWVDSARSEATPSVLKVGDPAPAISAKTDSGEAFELNSRRGHWTVLYFYPKAETPGCTKQACSFRDSIEKIRKLDAEVVGVSADTVSDLAGFKRHHNLNFKLLADPEMSIIHKYGVAKEGVKVAKRWTFIVDPELRIRDIDRDVDPVKDADAAAAKIKKLQIEVSAAATPIH